MTVSNCVGLVWAIAAGLKTLKITQHRKAPAVTGCCCDWAMGLVQACELFFSRGRETAQVLLTHEELADRKRYLNALTAENLSNLV